MLVRRPSIRIPGCGVWDIPWKSLEATNKIPLWWGCRLHLSKTQNTWSNLAAREVQNSQGFKLTLDLTLRFGLVHFKALSFFHVKYLRISTHHHKPPKLLHDKCNANKNMYKRWLVTLLPSNSISSWRFLPTSELWMQKITPVKPKASNQMEGESSS